MVQASPMVRDQLGPALLHTYAAVKVFEGLDVDKEDFDKYEVRDQSATPSPLEQRGLQGLHLETVWLQKVPGLSSPTSYLLLLSLLRSFGGLEYCMDTLFI